MTHWLLVRTPKYLALLLVSDILFFTLFSPATSNSFILIAGCMLLGVTLYAVFRMLGRFLALLSGIPLIAQRRLAIFATVLGMFLLLMQSIGQLSRRDVLVAGLLSAVLYLYISYIYQAGGGPAAKDTRTDRN